MLGKRSTDPTPATRFRSDRISSVNGQYFFSTREGTLEGPISPVSTRSGKSTRISAGCANRRKSTRRVPAETIQALNLFPGG